MRSSFFIAILTLCFCHFANAKDRNILQICLDLMLGRQNTDDTILIPSSAHSLSEDHILKFLRQKKIEKEIWLEIKNEAKGLLTQFKYLTSKYKQDYLPAISQEINQIILNRFGTLNLALHYNLHGGDGLDYVKKGGILANRSHHCYSRDLCFSSDDQQVYFFRLIDNFLHQILHETNPYTAPFNYGRMGTNLIIFNLNHPAFSDGRIKAEGNSSITFNEDWIKQNRENGSTVGIPLESFILYPIDIFKQKATKLTFLYLSRTEVTFLNLIFLKRLLERIPNS
ncbi:MAG: hypothetical protein KBD63_05165 [Bacteriovoracaceae bacterium]|nr:hypothetical protein [Bacteriovoracaceae bacterium]